MRIGKFFSSRNKTATPRRIPDDSLAEIQTRTSRSSAKYSISFRFISRRGNFSFPLPLGSFSHRLFVRNPSLPLPSFYLSSSFRGENPHLSEQRRTSLRSLRVGRLFISSSHAPPSPPILRFLRSVSASPATRLFVIFRSACFPPKLGPSTRKTVHQIPRRPDKSRWRNHLLLFAITHLVDYTKSIDTERVK